MSQLYYAFIYSRIIYGKEVYGACSYTLSNKIQTIQNKLLKFFLNLDPRHPTDILHANLKILKVSDMYVINILNFVKKNYVSGKCPQIFQNYYVQQLHRYEVRDRKLQVPRSRTALGSLSLKIKGATLWNNMTQELKDKANNKNFKKILTKYYCSRYNN